MKTKNKTNKTNNNNNKKKHVIKQNHEDSFALAIYFKTFTCLWFIYYLQVNGSFHRPSVLALPMAAVCSLVVFRHVKNREDEFFLAFALSILFLYFIFFTTFRQMRCIVV